MKKSTKPKKIKQYTLVAPDGTPILGTYERVNGVSAVAHVSSKDGKTFDGKDAIEYTGETEIFWEEQQTIRSYGGESPSEMLFIDENHCTWPQSELILKPCTKAI